MTQVLHGRRLRGIVQTIVQSGATSWLSVSPDTSVSARTAVSDPTIDVWLADLDALQAWAAPYANWLDATERQRADRLRHESLHARYITSRVLLRGVLGAEMGIDPRDISFAVTAHGKPQIDAGQAALSCNWSHSRNLLLLGIARETSIGVDVEAPRVIERAARLGERVFSVAENLALHQAAALSKAQRDTAFATIWTRKEALLKMYGHGFSVPARDFHVGADPQSDIQLDDARVKSLPLPCRGHAAIAWQGSADKVIRCFLLGHAPQV